MFSEMKFEFVQTATENSSFSTRPDACACSTPSPAAAPGRAACATAGSSSSTAASTSPSASTPCAPACCSRPASGTAPSRPTPTAPTPSRASPTSRPGWPSSSAGRVGDPLVSYSQYQAGWYLQDDFRLTKNLQVSLGLRQEMQTHVDDSWNLAPRAAFTWTVAKTNIRGGWGIFYDWFDSGTYEQTLRSTARSRSTQFILNPTYPLSVDETGDAAAAEPSSRWPTSSTSRSCSRPRSASTRTSPRPSACAPTTCGRAATGILRSMNVNAPIDGVRPDPSPATSPRSARPGERAQDRTHRRAELADPEPAHLHEPDVSVRQQPQLRRLDAEPAVRFDQSRCRLGAVGATTSATGCS